MKAAFLSGMPTPWDEVHNVWEADAADSATGCHGNAAGPSGCLGEAPLLPTAEWRSLLVPKDFQPDRLNVLQEEKWIAEFGTDLRITSIAAKVRGGACTGVHATRIRRLAERAQDGRTFRPLILVAPESAEPLIAMDGNHRAVALYLTSRLIGHSVYVSVYRDVRYYCRYPHGKPGHVTH